MRVPPYSMEAEQAVIGGLLLDGAAWDKVAAILTRQDFYVSDHGLLFETIQKLIERREPCDALTVAEALKGRAPGDESKLMSYLAMLAADTPSAANIDAYARIVHRDATRRRLIGVATGIIETAYKPPDESSEELIDAAEQQIFDLKNHERRLTGFEKIQQLSEDVYKNTRERSKQKGEITGLATGFKTLDRQTSGLQKSDLIIIAGRPSMGKTSLALNIAEHAAIVEKKPVAIFSLEMSNSQIVSRFFASHGRINQERLRNGNLKDDEWAKMVEVNQALWDAPIYIDDSAVLTPLDVRSRVRRLKREQGDLALVIIDYMQLMTTTGKAENRTIEIGQISRSLKALAKEMEVPLIALSQLNRNPEARQGKPELADLRESGAIEQDADLVAMIYREKNKEDTEKDNRAGGVMLLHVVKHRNGPTFTSYLTFHGHYTRFENYFPDEALAAQHVPSYNRPFVTAFDD